MVRSNFTFVRLSDDGTQLRVNGESEVVGEIRELRVAVAAPKPADASNVGADLAPPPKDQLVATLDGPINSPWAVLIPVEAGTFERGDLVVIAGGELRTPAADDASGGDDLELSTWVGCTTVMLESDGKP